MELQRVVVQRWMCTAHCAVGQEPFYTLLGPMILSISLSSNLPCAALANRNWRLLEQLELLDALLETH